MLRMAKKMAMQPLHHTALLFMARRSLVCPAPVGLFVGSAANWIGIISPNEDTKWKFAYSTRTPDNIGTTAGNSAHARISKTSRISTIVMEGSGAHPSASW